MRKPLRRKARLVRGRKRSVSASVALPSTSAEGASVLLAQMLKESEERALSAERKYRVLHDALASILTNDQKEAASIAGCDEAVYAIEYIKLQKEIFFPNHNALFKGLKELNRSYK